jgi:hypothetical protein|tara:strand:+ start:915 stop:1121 length:207 start_codon:yes stop_codon:yes gene_type:complete
MEVPMVQTSKLKKEFNKRGLQINREAIELLDDHISREVSKMANRVKEGNVKRLTADLIWVALGKFNNQ